MSYVPSSLGVMLIHVSIQVTPISASPFRVMVVEASEEASSADGIKTGSVSKSKEPENEKLPTTTITEPSSGQDRCQELPTEPLKQAPLAPVDES